MLYMQYILSRSYISWLVCSLQTYFKLKLATIPEILVDAQLDYDKIKQVELVLQAQVSLTNGCFSSNKLKGTLSVSVR